MKIRIECEGAENLPLGSLIPTQDELKELSNDNYAKLKNEILAEGFSFPFFVWKHEGRNQILDGHHRRLVLLKMREEGYDIPDLPCAIVKANNEREAARKLLAVTSQYAKITDQGLYEFMNKFDIDMEEMKGRFEFSDIDMELFEDNFFGSADEAPEGDEDAVPEIPKDPVTRKGDVWLLGKHRLLCGDSTSIDELEKLCNGLKVDMWLTDPPYNVDYEGKTKDALTIENDKMNDGDFRQFLTDSYTAADTVMKPGAVFYIWHADSEGYNFRGAAQDAGWKVRQCLIWKKQTMVMGRQDYHWKHEPCLYGWKEGAGHLWASDRKQTTIMEFDRPFRNAEHPTMKPIDLFEYQMLNNTKGGDIVLDSFSGSGTTIIAAEKNGRIGYGMEFDPKYCDVIVERWQEYTGKKAKLETGELYNDLKEKRESNTEVQMPSAM